MVLLFSVALADVDLATMTVDELITLKTQIEQELINRGAVKSATVPAGKYIVGKDIPAGDYSISTSQYMVVVTIGSLNMYVVTPDEGVGKVTLNEGDSFECSSTIVLTKYAGLNFDF